MKIHFTPFGDSAFIFNDTREDLMTMLELLIFLDDHNSDDSNKQVLNGFINAIMHELGEAIQ